MLKVCGILALASCPAAAAQKSPFLASDLPVSKLDFYETFDEKTGGLFTSGRWTKSGAGKYRQQPVMVRPALRAPPGFEKDKGLQLTQEMKYYGVSTMLQTPFAPSGGDTVLQYEIKFDVFTCGGAYLKFLRAPEGEGQALDLLGVDNDSPFSVMFGPDRCGADNKVHFIMQHQSPVTGAWEEKHFAEAPGVEADKLTHLYTLAIHGADNSFEIYIDKRKRAEGNLLTSMRPPINPPLEVADPSDEKPADWVDAAQVPDPQASKPEDWDESQPAMVPDLSVSMPLGWEVDWPLVAADPTASKPEDWDDEEDGEWEAPEVPNAACDAVPGCGPWAPPSKKNPAYKGRWAAPLIDNPAYVGEWAPRQVPNADYFEEPHPSHLAPIAAVAVEVWTTNPGIHYDNIIIAHSLDDAFAFADASFGVKRAAELKKDMDDEAAAAAEAEADTLAKGGIRAYVETYILKFILFLNDNPHLQSRFYSVMNIFSSILGPDGMLFVQENASSIMIGFLVVFFTIAIFVCCACVIPFGSKNDSDADEYEEEEPEPAPSASGNEADAEPEEESDSAPGAKQRKTKSKKEN
jgi:calnexin